MKLGFTLRRVHTKIKVLFLMFLALISNLVWLALDLSKFKKIDTGRIKKLLVVYGGAIGDTYIVIGMLNRLKEDYPHLQVYYLTFKNNRKFVNSPLIRVLNLREAKRLTSERAFDAAVLLDPLPFRKELYFSLFKVPYRAGTGDFNLVPLPLTRKILKFYSGIVEQVEVFKKLGFKIDNLKFYFQKKDEIYAENFIKKNKIRKNEKLVFLHAGAGTISRALREGKVPSHAWPVERWAEVANKLIERYNARIIFTGTNEEKVIIDKILAGIKDRKKVIDTSRKLTIEQIASIMRRSDLLVTIDTSMAHIGGQTGITLIDLFGPFDPKLAEPYKARKIVLFHPEVCCRCKKYYCPEDNAVCMKAISVEEVLKVADSLLKNGK